MPCTQESKSIYIYEIYDGSVFTEQLFAPNTDLSALDKALITSSRISENGKYFLIDKNGAVLKSDDLNSSEKEPLILVKITFGGPNPPLSLKRFRDNDYLKTTPYSQIHQIIELPNGPQKSMESVKISTIFIELAKNYFQSISKLHRSHLMLLSRWLAIAKRVSTSAAKYNRISLHFLEYKTENKFKLELNWKEACDNYIVLSLQTEEGDHYDVIATNKNEDGYELRMEDAEWDYTAIMREVKIKPLGSFEDFFSRSQINSIAVLEKRLQTVVEHLKLIVKNIVEIIRDENVKLNSDEKLKMMWKNHVRLRNLLKEALISEHIFRRDIFINLCPLLWREGFQKNF